jgi:trimeric autotransporter adhesin
MMRAVETRGRRQLIAAGRMLRQFLLVGAWGAVACSDATGTPENVVASVAVTPPASTITVGAELPLQVIVQDATGQTVTGVSVFWSVKDPGIASVSSSGVVTGLATGATQVAASAGGKSAIAAITVQRVPVASVVVRPATAQATTGNQVQFSATIYDANQIALTDRSIAWSSSNEAVATVDSTGLATAISPGVATITATSELRSDAATITVALVPVAMVTVEPSTVTVGSGSTTTLTARVTTQSGGLLTDRAVTWISSNPAVATVSSTGVVTAVVTGALVGTATITGSAEGKSGSASVTVTPGPIASVRVTPPTTSLAIGSRVDLTAVALDAAGNQISGVTFTWASSNPAIASVSLDGEVNAKKEGTVTITAITLGTSGSATVTVTK